jgi:hypothetical protein
VGSGGAGSCQISRFLVFHARLRKRCSRTAHISPIGAVVGLPLYGVVGVAIPSASSTLGAAKQLSGFASHLQVCQGASRPSEVLDDSDL